MMSVTKKLKEGAVTGQRVHRERITSIGVQGGPRQGVGFALRTEGWKGADHVRVFLEKEEIRGHGPISL